MRGVCDLLPTTVRAAATIKTPQGVLFTRGVTLTVKSHLLHSAAALKTKGNSAGFAF